MDRRTALERLDAVRIGSEDFSEPEMSGLDGLLASDADLRDEFDRRRGWDREIAARLQDVAIPADLEERLLARLSLPVVPTRSAAAVNRRRALGATAAAAAAIVVAATAYWSVIDSVRPVTVVESQKAAAELLDADADAPFCGRFEPAFPDESWQVRMIVSTETIGLLPEGRQHRAAAWRFQLPGRPRRSGVLVAIPRSNVISPPQANSIFDGAYVPQPGGIEAVSWTKGEFVYVCAVEGGVDNLLRRLQSVAV